MGPQQFTSQEPPPPPSRQPEEFVLSTEYTVIRQTPDVLQSVIVPNFRAGLRSRGAVRHDLIDQDGIKGEGAHAAQ